MGFYLCAEQKNQDICTENGSSDSPAVIERGETCFVTSPKLDLLSIKSIPDFIAGGRRSGKKLFSCLFTKPDAVLSELKKVHTSEILHELS